MRLKNYHRSFKCRGSTLAEEKRKEERRKFSFRPMLTCSLMSQTFTCIMVMSVDISILVAVQVERTECKFCCVINQNICVYIIRVYYIRLCWSPHANMNIAWNARDYQYCHLIGPYQISVMSQM